MSKKNPIFLLSLIAAERQLEMSAAPPEKIKGKSFTLLQPDGTIVKGRNIREFCSERDLSYDRICQVLTGKNYSHRGYRVPGVEKTHRGKPFKLVSPDGVVYEGNNISQFAREHNLCSQGLTTVINGKQRHYKQWTLDGNREGARVREVGFCFISPSGEIYKGTNIRAFARQNDLALAALYKLQRGKQKQYKGWRKGNG